MNELEEIKNWLNSNRDFDRGIMLFIAYMNEPVMRRHLEQTRNEEKLFEVMRKRFYALKDAQVTISENTPLPSPKAETKAEVITVLKSPWDLGVLDKRWREIKTEMATWHTEMFLIGEKSITLNESQRKQRAGFAEKILAHEAELSRLSVAYEHVKEYGKLPEGLSDNFLKPIENCPKADFSNVTDSDKIKLLKNSIAPNISKLKSKIADKKNELPQLAGRAHGKAIQKIEAWENKLQVLEKQKIELTEAYAQ